MCSNAYQGMDNARASNGESLPITVEMGTNKTGRGGMLLMGVVIIGLAGAAAVNPELFPVAGIAQEFRWLILGGIALIGLRYGGRALLTFGASGSATIDADQVRFKRRGLLKSADWREPLGSYRGVRWSQTHTMSERPTYMKTTTTQWIELAHPDPDKSLPLFSEKVSDTEARQEWERLSTATGLPAIDAREVEEVTRDSDDVDKSVGDLAAESAHAMPRPDTAAPARFAVKYEGGSGLSEARAVTVTLPPGIPQTFWRALQVVLVLVMLIGIFQFSIGIILFTGLFLVLIEYFRRTSEHSPRTLEVTKEELRYEDPARASQSFSLPVDAIENIDIVKVTLGKMEGSKAQVDAISKLVSRQVLVIGSDRMERRIDGLNSDEYEWLRRFLRSAVADA